MKIPRWLVICAVALVALLGTAGPASAARPRPPVSIATIPPVPDFPVTLDGITVLTDAQGVARFQTTVSDNLTVRLKLRDAYMNIDGAPAHVLASRVFPTGLPRLSLDVYWQVRFTYSNSSGQQIDQTKIDRLTVKSSTGQVLTLPPGDSAWLQGSRVVPLSGGLEVKKIYWTVQDVGYSGSNVVNASQQRFQPADTQAVTVDLLFYRAVFTVHDAFFGFRTGSRIALTYPDKSVVRTSIGGNGRLLLPSLPRGNYSVLVDGPGPRMSRPVAISRDQTVDLKFYSWLDIVAAVVLLGLFTAGTLLIGLRRRRRHRRPADRGEDAAARDDGGPRLLVAPELEAGGVQKAHAGDLR